MTGEKCGVFAMYGNDECVHDIYRGLDFLQHRGQEYCGISVFGDGINHVTHHGKVVERFTDAELSQLQGRWGIGHVSLLERQPMKWQTHIGEVAVAFSGNVINADSLIEEMMARGKSFYKQYHVEILSKIIIEAGDIVDGLVKVASKVRGAYSLVVLTKEGIYAARDPLGFRPLVLGSDGKRHAVSSESRALQNLDLEIVRDVEPGEVVLIDHRGFTTVCRVPSKRIAHCAFEWAYTASIDSIIDGLSVQEARNNLGRELAQRDIDEGGIEADIVAPIPLSGIGHAIGYHMQSGMNYQEVFLYHRYADRSYMQANQAARDRMAKRKLSVLTHAVKNRRIVICDDSIVRGTQIRHKVRDLKDAGAREVHVRVACPPLMYPCDFGISTRTREELIARRFLPDGKFQSLDEQRALERWIAAETAADSVKFNSIDAFVRALGISRGRLCLACFDGMWPFNEQESRQQSFK
ncbi:MAG: amidophosphoribosyltransferase [Deltaproteobacteria bacterium]|nr:amidophosphoribosyltransferase [Deltaproteobacteria bacterium]